MTQDEITLNRKGYTCLKQDNDYRQRVVSWVTISKRQFEIMRNISQEMKLGTITPEEASHKIDDFLTK